MIVINEINTTPCRYRGVEVQLHELLVSAVNGGESSALCPRDSTRRELGHLPFILQQLITKIPVNN
jgi:hypothetical protein